MTLTPKQQKVLNYIRKYFDEMGESPTYQEIQLHFNFKSLGSVVDYIKYLKKAGLVRTNSAHSARSLELVEQSEDNLLIPVLGKVAAGTPLTLLGDRDFCDNISVPQSMLTGGECFALEVEGDSMIEDGIFEGDYVVIKSTKSVSNGQTVVAMVDDGATIKKYFKRSDHIELQPANSALSSIIVKKHQEFAIQGVLVALLRRY
ncbi:MAG: transcriptional repressor LexA [Halobacteriovoraceae bacterium]|nr:transcriptional repressor LexA [Halobacteriovoraceae bacterium]